MSNHKDDVEALLYPSMEERPELRWAFIRKVYSILALQLLVTIAVAAAVAALRPIAIFFATTWAGLAVYIVLVVAIIIVTFLLAIFRDKHPLNFILLGIFTLCFGLLLGLATSFTNGRVILEAAIVTTVIVVSLTVYTFWAAKRGQDFGFLIPLLITIIITLVLFTIFQIFFPMGRISEMIYGGIAVIVFCIYIIYDTDTLIKRHSYDQYIWASVALYLDVLNVFLRLLQIFRAANRS